MYMCVYVCNTKQQGTDKEQGAGAASEDSGGKAWTQQPHHIQVVPARNDDPEGPMGLQTLHQLGQTVTLGAELSADFTE
jgi:hypothetical protein